MNRVNSMLFIVGLSLSKVVFFLIFPLMYAFITNSSGSVEFLFTLIITLLPALFFMRPGIKPNFDFQSSDIFLLTFIIWLVDCLFSAFPFCFILQCSYTDAFFETMSGLTTFGGTVYSNLDSMPQSLLLWRSMLQWIGGVGFVVIAVAVLPKLNVGGMKLFQTEASEKNKDTPKATTLAKNIIVVYVVGTVSCFICYLFCDMSVFDAICHSMTTLATGGFSTHDSSMAFFDPNVQWVCIIFMLLGSLPFMLYAKCIRRKDISFLVRNQQVYGYIRFILIVSLFLSAVLFFKHDFAFFESVRYAFFNTVSIITTSGFALGDWTSWGALVSMVVLCILPLGGCTGGTSGGIKYFRIQIIAVLLKRQCQELLHPMAIISQSYEGQLISDRIIRSVVAFFLSYVLVVLVSSLLITIQDVDLIVALTSSISAVSNVGPAYGSENVIGANYAYLPSFAKWVLSADMLCGRLEILTVMVIFLPRIWKITNN